MVVFTWSSASILAALIASPAPAPERTTETEPAETVETPIVEPTAEPVPEPEPEPVPELEPVPEPELESEPAPIQARHHDHDDHDDHDRTHDRDHPVARFEPGQWGMQFTFGGLAPMSIAGLRDFGVNRLIFTELGFRRVMSEKWVIPFSLGAGVFHHNPDAGDSQNDVGLAASVGVQRYFRVWRRIAPYVGGRMRLSYAEPNGRANWMVGYGVGPMMGIEYFVADRVSLSLQGDALIGFNSFAGLLQVEFATRVDAGGQMGLVFYF